MWIDPIDLGQRSGERYLFRHIDSADGEWCPQRSPAPEHRKPNQSTGNIVFQAFRLLTRKGVYHTPSETTAAFPASVKLYLCSR